MKGKFCVIRTRSAGVHFGILFSRKGQEVVLKKARRLWYWKGARTLSEVSQAGINQSESKVSVVVPEILLSEAIEVIPCSAAARKSLEGATWA